MEKDKASPQVDPSPARLETPVFSREELDAWGAYWEALAKAPPQQRRLQEEALQKQRKLPPERMEAMETWAMQWTARCAALLPEETLPGEIQPIEAKAPCWEEAGRAGGEEAARWLYEHHARLAKLWEDWLRAEGLPPVQNP